MRVQLLVGAAALLITATCVPPALAQHPVAYRLSFPEPEHRWMEVEIGFTDLGPPPLQLRMSRSSPGRYALHEFAKNVYDVRATDEKGVGLARIIHETADVI